MPRAVLPWIPLALALSLLSLAACLTSPPPPPAPPVPPAGTGEELAPAHRELRALAGDWEVTVTAPGREAPLGSGRARLVPLHGGRFLRLEVELELQGRPLTSTGHLGHDTRMREWQALWLSGVSNGMALLRGRGDLERGVDLVGELRGVRGRSRLRLVGPDELRVETFGPGPDGGERLLRTTTYVRR